MKHYLTVVYTGKLDLTVEAPDQDTAEEVALDEIDTWSEALFISRLDLEIQDIEFQD